MQTIKSQLFAQRQIYFPSIIPNVTNNKIELGKTVSLASFQKNTISIRFNLLQVSQSRPTFLLCYFKLFLIAWTIILIYISLNSRDTATLTDPSGAPNDCFL